MSIGPTPPRTVEPSGSTAATTTTTSTTATTTTTGTTRTAGTTGITPAATGTRPRSTGKTLFTTSQDGTSSSVSEQQAMERRSGKGGKKPVHVRMTSVDVPGQSRTTKKTDHHKTPSYNARHTLAEDVREVRSTLRQGVLSADDELTNIFKGVLSKDASAVAASAKRYAAALKALSPTSYADPAADRERFHGRLQDRMAVMLQPQLDALGSAFAAHRAGDAVIDSIHAAVRTEIESREEVRLKPWPLGVQPALLTREFTAERNLLDAFAALRSKSVKLAAKANEKFNLHLQQDAPRLSAVQSPRLEDYENCLRFRLSDMAIEVVQAYQDLVKAFPDAGNPFIERLGKALNRELEQRPARLAALASADAHMADIVALLMSKKTFDVTWQVEQFLKTLRPLAQTHRSNNTSNANDPEAVAVNLYGSRLKPVIDTMHSQHLEELLDGVQRYLASSKDLVVESIRAAVDEELDLRAKAQIHRHRASSGSGSSS